MTEVMWIVTEVAPYRHGPAGVHRVLPQARGALEEIAGMVGLGAVAVPRVADVPASSFASGGVLGLFTIGETPFDDDQRQAIAAAWRAGRLAILGIHAATDACHAWGDYKKLLGGRFDGHPWTTSMQIDVADRGHPATAHLPDPWGWHDEVYLFTHLRKDARTLLSWDPGDAPVPAKAARGATGALPLAWCLEEGGGTFYTSLGHFSEAWEDPVYLAHLAGGLSWLLERRQEA